MSALAAVADMAGAILVVAGALFALTGSWGLVKLSTFLTRIHGPTKATTLGVGCVLIASMIHFALRGTPSLHELLVTLGLFLTAPVSAHLMVKTAMALDESGRPPPPPGPDGGAWPAASRTAADPDPGAGPDQAG